LLKQKIIGEAIDSKKLTTEKFLKHNFPLNHLFSFLALSENFIKSEVETIYLEENWF